MERRTFLKNAGFAAAAPFFVSNGLFANGSPNDKINLGLIGLGKMMSGHISGLLYDKSVRITSICDVDDERLSFNKNRIESFYKKRGESVAVKTHKDFRNLLADKSVDAVFIVTPDHWHAIISVLAARAGKHIYCEKPLTFTVDEGRQIIDAVNANGVVFQTGSQQRSEASFREAVRLARSGMLGEIKQVWCNIGRKFPVIYNWAAEETPKGVDWDMWIGPAPMRPFSSNLLPFLAPSPNRYSHQWGAWRWHYDYGNGMQADWGAHHFDIAQWGLGMDGKGPKYVHVFEDQNRSIKSDTRNICYEYANGVMVYYGQPKILAERGYPHGSAMVTFVGTEGVATASRGGIFWADKLSLRSGKIAPKKDFPYVCEGHKDNFFNAIRTGRPPICPAEIGVSSCNMCIIGNIAYKLGRRLEWDWKTRRFVGDSDANKYLSRKNRGEWANIA